MINERGGVFAGHGTRLVFVKSLGWKTGSFWGAKYFYPELEKGKGAGRSVKTSRGRFTFSIVMSHGQKMSKTNSKMQHVVGI